MEDIKSKVVKLVAEVKKLQVQCAELTEENAKLRQDNIDANIQVQELKANYERLKLAKAFGMSEESKKEAHRRITRLVQTIESSIDSLKNT